MNKKQTASKSKQSQPESKSPQSEAKKTKPGSRKTKPGSQKTKIESKKTKTESKATQPKSKETKPGSKETKIESKKTNKEAKKVPSAGKTKSLIRQSPKSKSQAGEKTKAAGKASASAKSAATIAKASRSQATQIMDALLALYPDSSCELVFASDFQLLIAVILSAQCTDQQVNRVTEKLYARFPDARALAEADLEEIKAIIKPTGYFNAKANNIQNCARMLITKYGGKVPQSVEELTVLPGVGRKTANVVLGVLHNIPGWSVDTHVQRLSKRFGFTREEDPLKIETDLQKLFPGQDWSKLSITIIWHGRRLCYARKPACGECPLQSFCPSSEV